MKREVSFFKDRRDHTGAALVKAMRELGMTDDEIRAALTDGLTAAAPHVDESLSSDSPELEHGAPAVNAPEEMGAAS